MIKKWFFNMPLAKRMITIIILILIVGGLIKAGYYTLHYGGTDLRERIVGARALGIGKSPYYYKWSYGESERLINPNIDQNRSINGVSVAPGTLYILTLFTSLSYPLLRIAWCIFQYLLILYIFYIFLFQKKLPSENRFLIVAIGGLFFLCSPVWFLHIERGQAYILYALFFCIFYKLYLNEEPLSYFFAGVVIAVAIYCRPTFMVMLIPIFLAFNKWAIAGLVAAAIPLGIDAWIHVKWWQDYMSAMAAFTGMPSNSAVVKNNFIASFPKIIEGASNLTLYKKDFSCGGITPLNVRVENLLNVHTADFYIGIYSIILIILSLLFRKKIQTNEPVVIALFGFLLYIISEYIMPAPRGAYNLIQWVFPVLLILQNLCLTLNRLILLISALCFINDIPYYLPFLHDIGELLLVYCSLDYLRTYKN